TRKSQYRLGPYSHQPQPKKAGNQGSGIVFEKLQYNPDTFSKSSFITPSTSEQKRTFWTAPACWLRSRLWEARQGIVTEVHLLSARTDAVRDLGRYRCKCEGEEIPDQRDKILHLWSLILKLKP